MTALNKHFQISWSDCKNEWREGTVWFQFARYITSQKGPLWWSAHTYLPLFFSILLQSSFQGDWVAKNASMMYFARHEYMTACGPLNTQYAVIYVADHVDLLAFWHFREQKRADLHRLHLSNPSTPPQFAAHKNPAHVKNWLYKVLAGIICDVAPSRFLFLPSVLVITVVKVLSTISCQTQ